MADHTHIEWTDATWNPIIGCSVISPGCSNCYAMKMAHRLEAMGVAHYAGATQKTKTGGVWTGKIALAPKHVITKPIWWKRPRRVFVNSMSDLFHEDVPEGWIDLAFSVMALAPQHTFQVLTKRSGRMRAYLSDPRTRRRIYEKVCDRVVFERLKVVLIAPGVDASQAPPGPRIHLDTWPLPNVWVGVSAENEDQAQARLPDLFHTPAAVRWASFEPLIGRIDVRRWIPAGRPARRPSGETIIVPHYYMAECHNCGWMGSSELCGVDRGFDDSDVYCPDCHASGADDGPAGKLDWAVVGGENGKRPMHPDWAREIRDACAVANVPFLFKQWGTHAWVERVEGDPTTLTPYRAGKRAAGRMLDGVLHDGYPEVRS